MSDPYLLYLANKNMFKLKKRQTKHKSIRLKSETLYMGGDKHGQIDTIICLLFLLLKDYNEWNKKNHHASFFNEMN